MKRIVTILCGMFFLIPNLKLHSQLYVASDSYVYVSNEPLYVNQAVELANNGNIYLRNGAQLLQGTASTPNKGSGQLSVFQEGTVNNFAYNLWTSPIGNGVLTSGNENFGVGMLKRPISVRLSNPATISASLDGLASPLTISQRWIYKYVGSSGYSEWEFVGPANTIAPGQGFIMKGTNGSDAIFSDNGVANNPGNAQRYDFRGRPNNGDIDVVVKNNQITLTGNPYPSAIDLKSFLTVAANPTAANCTGIAYFWEQDKTVNSHVLTAYRGGYGAYAAATNIYQVPAFFRYDSAGNPIASAGSGHAYPRQFSPIGQGFMIRGTANGAVKMKNAFRVFKREGSDSHFEKTNSLVDETPHIKINTILNNEAARQMTLAFHKDATNEIDHGMDAELVDVNSTDVFFPIDGKEFVIETVKFDTDQKIPLGFKNQVPAHFKIRVGELVNVDESQTVFLHDKNDDSFHDIKNTAYEMTLPAGSNTTQFEIVFKQNALSAANFKKLNFDVLQDNVAQQLTVTNPERVEVKFVRIYDVSGKLIFEHSNFGTKEAVQFSTISFNDGIYVVKIEAENQQFSKKIQVFKRK